MLWFSKSATAFQDYSVHSDEGKAKFLWSIYFSISLYSFHFSECSISVCVLAVTFVQVVLKMVWERSPLSVSNFIAFKNILIAVGKLHFCLVSCTIVKYFFINLFYNSQSHPNHSYPVIHFLSFSLVHFEGVKSKI